MVTEAGKELLRNTINTATFHNKILEENEMWKQWEKECGLTMMVSDDDILKRIRKNHQCSKHRRRDKSRNRDKYKAGKSPGSSAGSSKDRWDHSGFAELYPDGVDSEKNQSASSFKKWDHSGFAELYPDSIGNERNASTSSSFDKHKKKRKIAIEPIPQMMKS
ncbi:uncharacterized protein CEXT_207131 [Caerostris extrusa]|uniref:Uncharacterized protein n=1 Tax=Caerostris extrusa TaxID=172846 RepID=A0AAV4RF96_CAEEX|nr:uncharacterized protein CEXT_207131 [Caerostris extrusa]